MQMCDFMFFDSICPYKHTWCQSWLRPIMIHSEAPKSIEINPSTTQKMCEVCFLSVDAPNLNRYESGNDNLSILHYEPYQLFHIARYPWTMASWDDIIMLPILSLAWGSNLIYCFYLFDTTCLLVDIKRNLFKILISHHQPTSKFIQLIICLLKRLS